MVAFKPDDVIGAYRIVRALGKGGMGAVYEVEHMKLGVHYALTPASDVYSLGVVFFKLLTGVQYEPCLATGGKTALRLPDHFDCNWNEILPSAAGWGFLV